MDELKLPSVHLTGKELAEIEDFIQENSTQESICLTLNSNIASETIPATSKLDNALLDEVVGYQLEVDCEEGRLRLAGDSKKPADHTLLIAGEPEWKDNVAKFIQSEIASQRSYWGRGRTVAENHLPALFVLFSAIVSMTVGTFVSGFVINAHPSVLNYVGFPLALTGLIALYRRNWVYPYVKVQKTNEEHPVKYRLYLIGIGSLLVLVFLMIYSSLFGNPLFPKEFL